SRMGALFRTGTPLPVDAPISVAGSSPEGEGAPRFGSYRARLSEMDRAWLRPPPEPGGTMEGGGERDHATAASRQPRCVCFARYSPVVKSLRARKSWHDTLSGRGAPSLPGLANRELLARAAAFPLVLPEDAPAGCNGRSASRGRAVAAENATGRRSVGSATSIARGGMGGSCKLDRRNGRLYRSFRARAPERSENLRKGRFAGAPDLPQLLVAVGAQSSV